MYISSVQKTSRPGQRSPVFWPGGIVHTLSDLILAGAFSLPALVSTTRFRRFMLAVALLEIPFRYGINLGWRAEDALVGALGGLEISLTTIAVVGLYTSLILERLISGPTLTSGACGNRWLYIYVAIAVISVAVATDRQLAFYEVAVLLQSVLLYRYLVRHTVTLADVQFIFRWLLIGYLLESLLIVLMGLTGASFRLPGMSGRLDVDVAFGGRFGTARVGGTVGSPNGAGTYLATLMGPLLVACVVSKARTDKMAGFAVLCLGWAAVFFTFSRSGWMGALLSCMLLLLVYLHRKRRLWSVAVLFLLLIAALSFDNPVSSRLVGSDSGAAASRVPLIRIALHMIANNPIIGVGSNNFTVEIPKYLTRDVSGEWIYAVHNKFLLIWAENGIFGIAAYVAFIITTAQLLWRVWKDAHKGISAMAFGLLSGLAANTLAAMFQVARGRLELQMLVIIAALAGSLAYVERQQSQPAIGRARSR